VKLGMQWFDFIPLLCLYVAATVTGSVLMHWISLRYLERGRRKVGA